MGGQQLPTIRMPENRQMPKDRQRKDSALEAPSTGHQPCGGTSPRTERLHNYLALDAPDTGHDIYYPAVNYLWSDLRPPLLLPFEVPCQGTSPSQKGKCTF